MQKLLSIGILSGKMNKIASHQHNIWEMVYYTEGEGILTIGDTEYPFQAGDFYGQPPGLNHSEYSLGGFKNIFFSVGTFRNYNNAVPHYHENINKDFLNIITQLHREYHMKRINWKHLTESLLGSLYQYMLSYNTETAVNPIVEKAKSILINNLANEKFLIGHLSREIYISPDHLRRTFKIYTGVSPMQYLLDIRIKNAMDLLKSKKDSGQTVKQIALFSGFSDPYYFSRLFHKKTGMAPSEWE